MARLEPEHPSHGWADYQIEDKPANGAGTVPRRGLYVPELFKIQTPPFLIKDLIPADGHVGIDGQPGSGKTFLAMHIAACVMTGTPCFGHEVVNPGPVIIIAAEGGRSRIRNRVKAMIDKFDMDPEKAELYVIADAVKLMPKGGDLHWIIPEIEEAARRWRKKPRLIIGDTLAQLLDGDENSSVDMGRFLTACSMLPATLGGAFISIHHLNKQGEPGGRGHSSRLGALDAQILVEEKAGGRLWTLSKLKDGPKDKTAHPFTLMRAPVGTDTTGAEVTSGFVREDDPASIAPSSSRRDGPKLGDKERAILDIVVDWYSKPSAIPLTLQALYREAEQRDIYMAKQDVQKRAHEVLNRLQAKQQIIKRNGIIDLPNRSKRDAGAGG